MNRPRLKCLTLSMTILAGACDIDAYSADEYCGEAFCIKGIGKEDVSKSTPVEDFNLYNVEYKGRNYLVYEGNSPADSGVAIENVKSNQGAGDSLLVRDREGLRLTIETGKEPWPQYVSVSVHCPHDTEYCGMIEFGNLIVVKEVLSG